MILMCISAIREAAHKLHKQNRNKAKRTKSLSQFSDLCVVGQWRMKWSTINLAAIEVGGGAHLHHTQGISNCLSLGLCCITSSTRCLYKSCISRRDDTEDDRIEGQWPTL